MPGVELLKLAVDALERGVAGEEPRVAQLLEALDYHASLATDRANAMALLKFATRLEAIFRLESHCAPGLACFGGMVRPSLAGPLHAGCENVSVTGKGMTLRAAFEGCVGEAAEYVSQLERDDDDLSFLDADFALAGLDPASRRELKQWLEISAEASARPSWLQAVRLSDGKAVFLPADFCLRRPAARQALTPPFLLGTGAAAGVTREAATLHAMLELIERDALSLWWRGGRRGCEVDRDASRFDLTIGALRRGRGERETWLLDITTELQTPCVVAISCAPDGTDFAFGAAARLTVEAAARAALLEVCQLELAYEVVRRKALERGEEALNATDRRHLARAGAINAKTCELVRPLAGTRRLNAGPGNAAELVARASRLGIEFHRVDMTRQSESIAAVRVLAPVLQPEPSRIVSDRLRAVIAETGGGDAHTGGAELL